MPDSPDSPRGKPMTPSPPPTDMSKKEFEDYSEQVEEFEGPDRREVRGEEERPKKESGIANS